MPQFSNSNITAPSSTKPARPKIGLLRTKPTMLQLQELAQIPKDSRFSYHNDSLYVRIKDKKYKRESSSSLYDILINFKENPTSADNPSEDFFNAQLLHYGFNPDEKKTESAQDRLLTAYMKGPPNGEMRIEPPLRILAMELKLREESIQNFQVEMDMIPKIRDVMGDYAVAAFAVETRMGFFSLNKPDAEELFDTIMEHPGTEKYLRDRLEELGVLKKGNMFISTDSVTVKDIRVSFFSLIKPVAEKFFDYFLDQQWDAECELRHNLENRGMIEKGRACNFTEYPEGYTGKKLNLVMPNALVAPRSSSNVALSPGPEKQGRPKVNMSSVPKTSQNQKILSNCHGLYKINTSSTSEIWLKPVDVKEEQIIQLCPSSTSSHLWGYFHFGNVYGILRSVGAPSAFRRNSLKVDFTWRGWVKVEGHSSPIMTFEDCNSGSLNFVGKTMIKDGSIKGKNGEATFKGHQIWKSLRPRGDKVTCWKRHWRVINEEWRKREDAKEMSKAVWVEPAADSDTTDCEDDEDDDADV